MKPKDRVLTAFDHQQPDRVPVDYASNPGIDHRLKDHFGVSRDDSMQSFTIPVAAFFRGNR